jgi:hypothetical protein
MNITKYKKQKIHEKAHNSLKTLENTSILPGKEPGPSSPGRSADICVIKIL